jgi:hypothetical protein
MKEMLEETFVDQVSLFLEQRGFKIKREVSPDECKNWNRPYRVDLIIFREDIGYVGIEAKSFNSLRKGGEIAKAFEQLKRYIPFHYFGESISKWGLLIYTNPFEETSIGQCQREVKEFIKNWLNFYSINFIEVDYDSQGKIDRIIIDRMKKESVYIK